MFRFAANEHGWPIRMAEHRPVACVPSPENIRDSPLPPNQRVTNPLGAQTGSLKVYVPLTRAYRRKHPMFIPHQKSRQRNLNMTKPRGWQQVDSAKTPFVICCANDCG
jgi:hypothetical protein